MTRIEIVAALGVALFTISAAAATKPASRYDVDLTILDHKTNPCDDFYQYACGGWLAKTEIPADRPMWNRSFSTIQLNNLRIMNTILKDYAAGRDTPPNPYTQLLGNFYGSCMDQKAIEKNALPELKSQLAEIDRVPDLKSLAPLLARLHNEGVDAFFSFGEEQDAKDSSQVIGVADQGGLGLPDRDYYLQKDPRMAKIRELYRAHIARMFKLLGDRHSSSEPDTIMGIETALAQASMSRVDRRDPQNVYHRLERKGLIERAPLIDWTTYLGALDPHTTPKLTAIDVSVPGFFVGLNQVLAKTPLPQLKTYLKWHLLTAMTEALPKRFVNERFQFTSHALTGQKKIEPRWKRCVRAADGSVGFALSRAFVDVAYGEAGKARSEEMVHEIENQFHKNLQTLGWLDKKTREKADEKLSKVTNKIGYPSVWRSYDGLQADRSSFLKSAEAAAVFDSLYDLDKIGKPVNRNDWDMTPATVNAYYDPQKNEMVFPAGILQYPFFSPKSPDWLNYGAIGMVMGHELTHGFDDQGRQYDANGNLKNWWDQSVLDRFKEKTACVVKEYSGFEALPGVHVNGELTLGENIADQGGIRFAYQAWTAKQGSGHSEAVASQSPTPVQKFFLSFAQSWCQKEREPYTRMRVTVDPHSPSRYRVDGVLSQFEPFAQAFSCQAGSKMAPAQRCEVW